MQHISERQIEPRYPTEADSQKEMINGSLDGLLRSDSKDDRHRQPKKQQTKKPPSEPTAIDPYSGEVPIYRIESCYHKISVQFNGENPSEYFAHGELIGRFQQIPDLHYLENISFVGIFNGMFDWRKIEETKENTPVFFEGSIQAIQFLTKADYQFKDKDIEQISLYESSFKGYFQGFFYPWKIVGGKQNIIEDSLIYKDDRHIPKTFLNKKNKNYRIVSDRIIGEDVTDIKKKTEYYLPTLVCFSINNIGDINLEKSSAVVNGNLYVQIKYNSYIDQILQDQKKNKKKHFVSLNFHRDITLFLPLQQDDEQDGSQSQWSIQDKTWDIELTKDKVNQILSQKISKRFGAEIDNSFGSFYAPFNLNRLKIVISISSTKLQYKDIKLHFACVDTFDYERSNNYNPFENFNQLAEDKQFNRYHKINRHFCTDNGEYIIADNRLALYPHFKNILKNRAYSDAEAKWNLGLGTWQQFLKPTLAQDAKKAFKYLKKLYHLQQKKFKKSQIPAFSFLRWDNVIIEIPIYKYIVIDMLKIFLPLTIITALSLFIFNQENGVGTQSQFTTLAYRLVNVASIAITYTAMIPIILSSLPKMPGITLIEIITYLETIPGLFAIFNSMMYYTIPLESWKQTFGAFHDTLFLIGFILSLFNLFILISVYGVYYCFEYNAKWKIDKDDRSKIKWRSPNYLEFIESVKDNKSDFYEIIEEQT